jgi:MoaA/NifB/PqqE/SkfB family radical SAM enzyme
LTGQIILDGHKMAWHKDRVEKFLKGERFAPISIEFALTRACTYHCVYCYSKLQYNDSKKMTWPVIKSFLEDAKEVGVLGMNLTSDGESTCSPYFLDTVTYGKSIGLDMACATNGYLLPNNKEDLEAILRSLTYLRFNISAGSPKRYSEIHGVPEGAFYEILNKIRQCTEIKKKESLQVTIGLQMVLLSQDEDQILPLAQLGKDVEADYLVIKHCSDDEFHTLGIDYSKYFEMIPTIKKAEALSTENYLVKAKWSKLLSGGKRNYERCYGPPFMLQFSGSGLVAPCGMLFNERYKDKFHLGNITETRFRDIFNSDRYWDVMKFLAGGVFDPKTMCGSLCLQHGINQYLWDLKESGKQPLDPVGEPPQHINFP